jgi:S1/P1 Nuclease
MPGDEEMRACATLVLRAAWIACLGFGSGAASAWGDEGHEVIGLVAEHYLQPAVRARVHELLGEDDTGLVARDLAHECTWADKYRDSDRDTTEIRYRGTREWHFVDLEIRGEDVDRACHGRPPLPPAVRASNGPAQDCIIDKIDQFYAELKNPATDRAERRLALQFLLHLVGDVHQPLHASDDHDQGGNRKRASAPGIEVDTLHHDWDTEFVALLGSNDTEIAQLLVARISERDRIRWSSGTPLDWAVETYGVAKAHTYGLLPPPTEGSYYRLPDVYVADATRVTLEQLSKAGVRLAFLLNRALE